MTAFIGIIGKEDSPNTQSPFRAQRSLYELLTQEGERVGAQVYIFSPLDNPNPSETLAAHIFEEGRWQKREMPRPNVIYDRGFFASLSPLERRLLHQAKKNLEDLLWVNPPSIARLTEDKLLFAQIMQEHYLPHPETLANSQKNREYMLAKHPLLYFKPRRGSQGQGIIVAQKEGTTFTFSYKKKDEEGQWQTLRLKDILPSQVFDCFTQIKEELGQSGRQYIIQQGINLFRYQGGQTDVRYASQRDTQGHLVSTGLVSRLWGNISQGGRPATFYQIATELSCRSVLSKNQIKQKVKKLCRAAHLALEKYANSQTGHLGFDLVFDQSGQPYLIEANNKAADLFIDLAHAYPHTPTERFAWERRNSYIKNIIGYALFLAQKNKG